MTGISVITALAIIADIATVERFPNAKHFTSYLRTAPEVDSSKVNTIWTIVCIAHNFRKLAKLQ